ncbi:MAG TPA: phosphoribosylformylglycinamidine synthase subunit PurL [Nitrososphaerales archaeon]|nr:phosphoribosylformylglycinamidine synthase subunit PurL [Nitrososphaerales archaeon]
MQRQSLELMRVDEKKAYQLCRRLGTGLSQAEVSHVRNHFRRLKREPTQLELQTIGQTWSEHCYHKIFKTQIKIGRESIAGLFKSYIKAATEAIQPNWVISSFSDNAGIIKFEETYSIAAKVETHNHPSAIDPFGGAATGVGGVIRDVLGVWAEPIANTDVLCFGQLDYPYSKLPAGIKHARYLLNGVVAGIGSYGNNVGIPTVNGAIYFDNGFSGYTLVFCGCIGLLKNRNYAKTAKQGDVLVIAGSRTGRDGIHGVNFASDKIAGDTDKLRSAVQIPDPIVEERLKRAVLEIADRHLASAITDLGGGGLSSAVCETARAFKCGADVDIASVPLKSHDLEPWEIWISETQERMLVVVPEATLAKVLSIFEREEIEASAMGKLVPGNDVVIRDREGELARLDLDFLFSPPLPALDAGLAIKIAEARKESPAVYPRNFQNSTNLSEDLIALLASPNISSREGIVRTYDHEVKGNTVVKPFQYPNSGPNDAAVLKPVPNSNKGLAISCGLSPALGAIDTYWMAATAIDEAVRNNVAVGGRRIALLDNFAWGDPVRSKQNLAGLVRAARSCYDVATAFGTPFVSGKDSLYNETPLGEIPPTLLITALGLVPEISRCVTADFKRDENAIYLIGETKAELAGSEYYRLKGLKGGAVPKLDPSRAANLYRAVNRAMDQGGIISCHDVSQGGIAVALAEMCFARALGAELTLSSIDLERDAKSTVAEFLFSESNSRFLVEVGKGEGEEKIEKTMKGFPFVRVGRVTAKGVIAIKDKRGQNAVSVLTEDAFGAWSRSLSKS